MCGVRGERPRVEKEPVAMSSQGVREPASKEGFRRAFVHSDLVRVVRRRKMRLRSMVERRLGAGRKVAMLSFGWLVGEVGSFLVFGSGSG